MALLCYSACQFGLSPTWLVVVVVLPLCCSCRHCHIESCSSSWCWADSSSSKNLLVLFVIAPLCLPRLVSICCCWFQFTVVGLGSPSLVSSHCSWFPGCLAPPSPSRLLLLLVSTFLLPSSSCSSSFSPLHCLTPALHCLTPHHHPPPFLLVVVSSPLRHRIAPHCCCFGASCRPSVSEGDEKRDSENEPQQMSWLVLRNSPLGTPASPVPHAILLPRFFVKWGWTTHIPEGWVQLLSASCIPGCWGLSPHPSHEGRGLSPGHCMWLRGSWSGEGGGGGEWEDEPKSTMMRLIMALNSAPPQR